MDVKFNYSTLLALHQTTITSHNLTHLLAPLILSSVYYLHRCQSKLLKIKGHTKSLIKILQGLTTAIKLKSNLLALAYKAQYYSSPDSCFSLTLCYTFPPLQLSSHDGLLCFQNMLKLWLSWELYIALSLPLFAWLQTVLFFQVSVPMVPP